MSEYNDTHIVIRPTNDFSAEKLGKFNGAMFPLQKTRFVPLTGITLHIDGEAFKTEPAMCLGGPIKELVNEGVHCIVHKVNPTPIQVKQSC